MPIAVPKKKRTLMPLLTVVFLCSYGLMTMLIVEQGTTIQAQRNLIQILLGDTRELWAMKGKAVSDKAAEARAHGHALVTQGQSPSVQTPSTRTPSTQAPSTQSQSAQSPSTQAAPQKHLQSWAGKTAKPQTHVPPMPASDLGDQRRALISI